MRLRIYFCSCIWLLLSPFFVFAEKAVETNELSPMEEPFFQFNLQNPQGIISITQQELEEMILYADELSAENLALTLSNQELQLENQRLKQNNKKLIFKTVGITVGVTVPLCSLAVILLKLNN